MNQSRHFEVSAISAIIFMAVESAPLTKPMYSVASMAKRNPERKRSAAIIRSLLSWDCFANRMAEMMMEAKEIKSGKTKNS